MSIRKVIRKLMVDGLVSRGAAADTVHYDDDQGCDYEEDLAWITHGRHVINVSVLERPRGSLILVIEAAVLVDYAVNSPDDFTTVECGEEVIDVSDPGMMASFARFMRKVHGDVAGTVDGSARP